MADDNRIEIVASLDRPKSVSTITNDLKWITDKLNANHALKIIGNLDLPKTTQRIQSQLATINKNLSLNINTIDVGANVSTVVNSIQNRLSNASAGVKAEIQVDKNPLDTLADALGNLEMPEKIIKKLQDDLASLNITITQITPSITQLKGATQQLSSISISGLDKSGNAVSFVERFNAETGDFERSTIKITENLARIEKENKKVEDSAKAAQIAYNDFLKLKGEADVYAKKYSGDESLKSQIADIQKLTSTFDNTQPIEKQREQIINLSNALKLLKVDIDNIKQSSASATTGGMLYPDIAKIGASGTDNSAQLERAKNDLNDFFQNIAKVEDSATRIKRAVSDTEGELTRFYVQVEKEDKSVETLTYALNEQGTAYEFLSKAIREADNSTDFRRKGLDVQKEIKTEDVNKFIEQLKAANLYTGDLKARADELRSSISKVADTNSMNKFLDDFDIAKAKFAALNAEAKSHNQIYKEIEKSIKVLQSYNVGATFKRNASNADVISQSGVNTNYINQLSEMLNSLNGDKSATNVDKIRQAFNSLIPSIEKATQDSRNLNNELKDDSSAQKANSKLNTLINQVNVFANTNRKATESLKQMRDGTSFADEWQRITNALKSGNLDANQIQRLADSFRNFRGEADAAGLTINRFFTSMQSQLRLVLQRWISLYAVVGYIRKMVDGVKELDTAMINLRRVTDETNTTYAEFLERANDQARALRTTTSALVEQSYQWAKLGYDMNDALELSKASTIFQKVADVDQEQSLKNLVTTLKAFNIEAKDTISVVDKLDKLNNNYAVSAAGLGEGLERSASAMAMTGNSLEQTLAMLTGAGEITQQLDNTGNALKIMSLRLQNMKGALQELDEPVDDLMEVSKVQTQILNLTHNQVDIFDSKTKEFRSTYDIMKDISEIWNDLSSVSRANLTEILFGKNRANYGLALIQAFQSGQVESAYKDALDAAGTATTEYNRMMEGIQSHLDSLKGTFQEFANTFIESSFIKSVVDFGNTTLRLLTEITDKFGSLPTVLLPVITIMSKKSGLNIFSAFSSILTSLSRTEINSTTVAVEELAIAESEAASATNALSTAETANTATTRANANAQRGLSTTVASTSKAVKSLAASFATGLAITVAISLLAKLIDKLVTTKEEIRELQAQESNTMRDNAERAKNYKDEADSLSDLIGQYNSIASSTIDLSTKKTELKNVQEQLAKTYGDEASGIDLVNGSYSEQIELLDKLDKKKAEDYLSTNRGNYEQAQAALGQGYYLIGRGFSGKFRDELNNLATEFNIKGYNAITGQLEGNLAERISAYKQLRDIYAEQEGHTAANLKLMEDELARLQGILDNAKYTTQEYQKQADILKEYKQLVQGDGSILSDQNRKDLNELQKMYGILSSEESDFNAYAQAYDKMLALQSKLKDVAEENYLVKQSVDALASSYEQNFSALPDNLSRLIERFDASLEGTFKETADLVTEVQSALEKMVDGKGVSHADAWKLLKADADGYLQTIQLVNGEYVFSEEELVKFKDNIIEKTKAEMQADIELAKANIQKTNAVIEREEKYLEDLKAELELKSLMGKINSESDARKYLDVIERMELSISESKKDVADYTELISRNTLLIDELNQNLGVSRTLADATAKSMQNAVKNFEAEIDAIDNTIDSLNDRKDILEGEKSALQDQLDILNEQKETIEQTIKNYDTVADAVSTLVKKQTDAIQEQIDAMEEAAEAIKKDYDDQISSLEEQNEERDDAIRKEKALADLQNAQNQKKRVYSSEKGWTYESSKSDILAAQKALADINNEMQIKALEKERDAKLKDIDDRKTEYNAQIKAYEEYAQKYADVASNIKQAESDLIAEQILGSEWRTKIEQMDEELLTKYSSEYVMFNTQLNDLVNNEIASLQESVDAKDEEIKKIDDEIKAYNKYKTAVQTNLKDAKSALESYQQAVSSVTTETNGLMSDMAQVAEEKCGAVADSVANMENSIWNNHNKILDWIHNVTNAMSGLLNETNELRSKDDFMNLVRAGHSMGYYADGGVNNYTGIAMLHGTKQKSETIFNANDSKKLYDMIHGTPNLLADAVKRANKITGFSPVNNNNTNSINVSIGQVVANNPQEFTRGLDRELDQYFRRKLTESYVQ